MFHNFINHLYFSCELSVLITCLYSSELFYFLSSLLGMRVILQIKAISHFITCSAITLTVCLVFCQTEVQIFTEIFQSAPLWLLGNRYFKFYFVTWKFKCFSERADWSVWGKREKGIIETVATLLQVEYKVKNKEVAGVLVAIEIVAQLRSILRERHPSRACWVLLLSGSSWATPVSSPDHAMKSTKHT